MDSSSSRESKDLVSPPDLCRIYQCIPFQAQSQAHCSCLSCCDYLPTSCPYLRNYESATSRLSETQTQTSILPTRTLASGTQTTKGGRPAWSLRALQVPPSPSPIHAQSINHFTRVPVLFHELRALCILPLLQSAQFFLVLPKRLSWASLLRSLPDPCSVQGCFAPGSKSKTEGPVEEVLS